jgi:NCAIR mutase (PurE)-related protein
MIRERALALLEEVRNGSVAPEQAVKQLAFDPFESLPHATIDHHRALRQGYPEVIFGAGKTPQQIVDIASCIADKGDGFLITRADKDAISAVRSAFTGVEINDLAHSAYLPPNVPLQLTTDSALIITAGTSDLPVAEEAAVAARAFGTRVERLTDVGVAGIHRVLSKREVLDSAGVVIVVAGMDGALPSVIGGLVRVPVIAVPTSVGYGASFNGLAALLCMLNSCASGVTVVNIDNGFGAAAAASRILRN